MISVSGANNFVKGGRGSDDIIAIGQGSAVLNEGRGNDTLMSTVKTAYSKAVVAKTKSSWTVT